MNRRTNRENYPDYVRTMTRLDPGMLQRDAGIPASLVHRARRGEVEGFSDSTLQKFKDVYNKYWESRLEKSGITPDNWAPLIEQHDVKGLREVVRGIEMTRRYDRALERGGVNPEEREGILRADTPEEIRDRIDKNLETAEKIVEARRERDKKLPGYNEDWHKVSDVLKQMARDTSRISSDWAWIAKYGSPKRKRPHTPGTRKCRRGRRSPQYEH